MTIRMGADEKSLINDYAKTFGMTASEFVRTAVLEHIEDELDLRDWYAAKAEFDADPTTDTADEIAKKYLCCGGFSSRKRLTNSFRSLIPGYGACWFHGS